LELGSVQLRRECSFDDGAMMDSVVGGGDFGDPSTFELAHFYEMPRNIPFQRCASVYFHDNVLGRISNDKIRIEETVARGLVE
jgi:hypothetical protein